MYKLTPFIMSTIFFFSWILIMLIFLKNVSDQIIDHDSIDCSLLKFSEITKLCTVYVEIPTSFQYLKTYDKQRLSTFNWPKILLT